MLPPDRRPLFGLILLAAVVITIDLMAAGLGVLVDRKEQPIAADRFCVYQIVRNDRALRTLFLKQPVTLAEVLGEAGIPRPEGLFSGESPVPCGCLVKIRGTDAPPIVERMTGRQLVAAGQRVDLNRSDPADLTAVPGLGPVLAQRIVDYRGSHGPFSSVEDLGRVPGIGPKKVRAFEPYLHVSGTGGEEAGRR